MRAARHACLLLVAAIASCQATEPVVEVPAVQPIKSPNDEREYRYVVLPNRLRALLIHAPDSDRAAAAVSVARGSDHDPDEHPGLAHFVEHMLFIATDKYPEIDGFTDFIGKNGGSRRAYTGSDRTTYYFSIKQNRLPEALDRFAQLFIAPTFDPDYTEREKESVQAEYQVQFKQDNWRAQSVHRRLFHPDYPGSRFNIGSLESLANAGVAEVRAFFEASYSADTITAAVLGPQDLDTLEALVAERFAPVVDRDLGPRPPNLPLYERGLLPASYAWRTLKDRRSLSFRFPIPPLRPHYRTKPASHLAALVGHEGRGSLHELLSQRGWIERLSTSSYSYDEGNSVFGISIGLTEEGSSRLDEIVDLTYAWLSLIRRDALVPWRYAENARQRALRLRFQEEGSATNAVVRAAEALYDYPPEDVVRAPYLMESFDEPLLRRYLDHLTPENSLVILSGPDIEGDRIEPVFDVTWRTGPGLHLWPVRSLLDALGRVTPETLASWRRTHLAGMGATLFVHGNLREDDARELAGLVQRRLDIGKVPHELPETKHVDGSRRYEQIVDHDDAAYALYIQGDSETVEEHARVGLIGRMLSGRYYTALRTERQLGYVVQAYSNPIARRPGIVLRVQASKIGVTEIEALTNAFLEEQRTWFRTLSKDEFEVRKSGYIAALTRADRNNYRRASRLLANLSMRVLTFDYAQQLADAVARLEPSDIADAYDALIDPARGNRLTVFSRGKPGTALIDGEPIDSIMAFKRP